MDPIHFGADVRLLRRRKGWTQVRLATEANVPRRAVLAIEGGRGDRQPAWRLMAVVAALGARMSIRIQFHGEVLDRLRDERHAAIVERVVAWLRANGWLVATEVSFNVYGDRGSIDILAFHPATGALVVIEVKSVVPEIGGMLMTLDTKVRLARKIADEQFGWRATTVSKLLVLPEHRTARRRVTDHLATFANAFPSRNVAVNRWLRHPDGPIAGLLFLSNVRHADPRRTSTDQAPRARRASRTT